METLRSFGHYSIVSEQIDNCLSEYDYIILFMTPVIGIFSTMFFLISALYDGALAFTILFLIIGFVGYFVGLYILESTCGCGVIIKLCDNNYKDYYLKEISYQFTDNPDYDASEIKNIIDEFEKYANRIDIVNKKREEEKLKLQKECCNKYKSVITKVK